MFKPQPYSIPLQPKNIAIQGMRGSFSHTASLAVFGDDPDIHECESFEDAFASVASGTRSDLGVIPFENTIAGKVPYVLELLRRTNLRIIGEYHLNIEHCILTLPDTNLLSVKTIHSHVHALAQCKGYLGRHPLFKTKVAADTAGAAKMISELGDETQASISPALSAQLYGLKIAQRGIQDNKNNITRFLVLSREPMAYPDEPDKDFVTSLFAKPFRSLAYPKRKILQAFEQANVAEPLMEEYRGPDFRNEGYYMEIVGHAQSLKQCFERLNRLCDIVDVIGSYPTHHFDRFPQRTGPKAAKD